MTSKLKAAWCAAQAVITEDIARALSLILVVATMCYLALIGRDIPHDVLLLAGAIVGYYFGKGSGNG